MAGSSEIEKLERRYAENPDGRYFAPLADAYRKTGQVDRALEVVRAGLEKHPDYLSAHIVLARCLVDKKEDDVAGRAFERVLALDAENIIALKSLSEIAERRGEGDQAREWLQKLLRIDPMNAEAEADLQRLGGHLETAPEPSLEGVPGEAASAGPSEFSFADVTPEAPAAGAPLEVAAPPDLGLMPSPAEAPAQTESVLPGIVSVQFRPPSEDVPPASIDVSPFDESLAWGTGERSSRSVSQDDVETALRSHDESLADASQVLGLSLSAGDGAAPPGTPAPSPAGAEDLATFEIVGGAPEAWHTGGPEALAAPAAPQPAAEAGAGQGLSDLPLITPDEVSPAEAVERPSASRARLDVEPLPDAAAVVEAAPAAPESPPMVTETMGDLYLRQGFRTEAADVYRSVLVQRPGDAGLRAKLAALEAPPALSAQALGGESVRTWLRRVAAGRVAAPAPTDAAVTPEGPSPLEEAFAQPEVPVEPIGEPTHPASDAFTLDAIFGGPPGAAQPSQPGPAPQAAPPPQAGTSFDEFFGAPADQSSVRPDPAAQPAPPPAEDDLSSFNTWLRGLKR